MSQGRQAVDDAGLEKWIVDWNSKQGMSGKAKSDDVRTRRLETSGIRAWKRAVKANDGKGCLVEKARNKDPAQGKQGKGK